MDSSRLRASGTRARRSLLLRSSLVTVLAVTGAVLPLGAAGAHAAAHAPAVAGLAAAPMVSGTTTPPANLPRRAPDDGSTWEPQAGGAIGWHKLSSVKLDDALSAQVDLSSGNLMLAATDFDLATVGQRVQVTRTYNSFFTADHTGMLGPQWLVGSSRKLRINGATVTVEDPTGVQILFTQSGTTYTPPAGFKYDLVKDTHTGGYVMTQRSDGSTSTFDSSGHLIQTADRNGNAITVTQSGTGNSLQTTSDGTSAKVSLDASAESVTLTDQGGRTVHYHLGTQSNAVQGTVTVLTSVDDSAGATTSYGYDQWGRVTSVTTPQGRKTAFTYDGQDRVTSMTRDGDLTTLYTYSASAPGVAGTTTVTDPAGNATVYTVDASGQVTATSDALGHSRSAKYDAQHDQTDAIDAMGTTGGSQGTSGAVVKGAVVAGRKTDRSLTPAAAGDLTAGNDTVYGWDTSGNQTSSQIPTGATSTLAYQHIAGAYLPSSLTDASGNSTAATFDTHGNVLTSTDSTSGGTGAKRVFTYNAAGQKTSATDGASGTGHTTSFTYDTTGHLTTVTPPLPLKPTTYTYDGFNRLHTATDGRGVVTTYTYDNRDRVTNVTAGSQSVSYTYDGDGNILTQTDASGTITYTYDGLGRESTRTLAGGQVLSLTYDAAGNVATYTDAAGTTTYGYNAADQLTSLTQPGGAKTTFTNNNDGQRIGTTYPGGTAQSVSLDHSGRPLEVKATDTDGTPQDDTFTYTVASGDTMKIQTRHTAVAGTTQTYTYDSLGRLTYALEKNGATRTASWLYCYDTAGNLTATSTTAASCSATSGLTSYTYNNDDQLTGTGWSYDDAGNETAAASPTGARTGEQYDALGRPTSITEGGTSLSATYAGTGASDRLTQGSTGFTDGPLGLDAATTSSATTGFIRDPQGTVIGMTTGGKTYYDLADVQGSVIALADSSGHTAATSTYTPTGVRRTTTGTVTSPLGYTGAYLNATGTYNLGARLYDPALDRFTQTDPTGQETNPYAYAGDDPVNRTDPNGQDWEDIVDGCAAGAVKGLAIGAVTGLDETGVGAGVAAGSGCGVGGATEYASENYGEDDGSDLEGLATGGDILDVLGAAADWW